MMGHVLRRSRCRLLLVLVLLIGVCLALHLWYPIWKQRRDVGSHDRPFFVKKHQYDCRALFGGAVDSRRYWRPVRSDYDSWRGAGDCGAIKDRRYYPSEPASEREGQFPLAYVIMADGGLEQLETLFNAIYAPHNYYCFHIDFRAHYMLHDFVRKLCGCFDGKRVFVSDQSVPIAPTSVSVLYAQRACMLKLVSAGQWRYVMTVESGDFPLRTNREIVNILSMHRGANDVELAPPLTYRYEKMHRPVTDKHGQPVDMEETGSGAPPPPLINLTLYKGSVASALSRQFAEFALTSRASLKLLSWLVGAYMPSELYVSTLNHDQTIQAPGGYPGRCLHPEKRKMWVSRFTVWNTYEKLQCKGRWKGGRCVFGEGDLATLVGRPELFAHQFHLHSSPIALDCLHEHLFNRTYSWRGPHTPFLAHYANLSAVQYQRWKVKTDGGHFQCVACQDCEH